jgi:non-homologous end joining protein Ku
VEYWMASPGRAYWKGVLRLSLVSIAVEIYNAVDTSTEIRFNQIHKPSEARPPSCVDPESCLPGPRS